MRKPQRPSKRLLRIAATLHAPVRAPTKAFRQVWGGDDRTKVDVLKFAAGPRWQCQRVPGADKTCLTITRGSLQHPVTRNMPAGGKLRAGIFFGDRPPRHLTPRGHTPLPNARTQK